MSTLRNSCLEPLSFKKILVYIWEPNGTHSQVVLVPKLDDEHSALACDIAAAFGGVRITVYFLATSDRSPAAHPGQTSCSREVFRGDLGSSTLHLICILATCLSLYGLGLQPLGRTFKYVCKLKTLPPSPKLNTYKRKQALPWISY